MSKIVVLFFCLAIQFISAQTTYSKKHTYNSSVKVNKEEYYKDNSIAYVYRNKDGIEMPYRLFLPPNYNPKKKYPLILSFHGAGSRGADNLKQLRPWVAGWMDNEIQQKNPCIILMPQCPKKQQWVNVPWKKGSYIFSKTSLSTPMKLAKSIFDKVISENAVDKKRIYVMGCSMGGYGAWNFVMHYHKLIAAAIPICGAGDPSMAITIKKTPIWAFHGDIDSTVPLSGSKEMVDSLYAQKKNKTRLTIYENIGHNSYEYAWRNPELIDWLFNQKKCIKK